MKTMPDTNQAASFQQTASADVPARFINRNLHRLWQTRRLQATLLRPFRRILHPLLVWLRRDALHLGHTPPASLRRVGWESLALGLLLGPRRFVVRLDDGIVVGVARRDLLRQCGRELRVHRR